MGVWVDLSVHLTNNLPEYLLRSPVCVCLCNQICYERHWVGAGQQLMKLQKQQT